MFRWFFIYSPWFSQRFSHIRHGFHPKPRAKNTAQVSNLPLQRMFQEGSCWAGFGLDLGSWDPRNCNMGEIFGEYSTNHGDFSWWFKGNFDWEITLVNWEFSEILKNLSVILIYFNGMCSFGSRNWVWSQQYQILTNDDDILHLLRC